MKKPTLLFLRKPLFLFISLLIFAQIFAQTSAETTVVIVACKSGTLIIDGSAIGPVDKDDATKQTLSFGEHYLQLKTETEKINLTINVDHNTKGVIKIGCEEVKIQQSNRLIDKQLELTGPLVNNPDANVIGLDKNDKIILNCDVLNKKGNATISIKEYYKGIEIYKKERFNTISGEEIKIPAKGIYSIIIHTDALFGKEVKLTLDRIAAPESDPLFNTVVQKVYDTTSVEVLNTVSRVYSVTNFSHPNKTTVSINLPKNTTYWAYWIGVGQEAQEKMKKFASAIASIGSYLPLNPLVKYGMNLIPFLPMFNSTATVCYRFMDSRNAQSFVNGGASNYYTFKHADNISTDYSLVNQNLTDLVLAMNNENTSIGQDVEIRVVAFVVTPKLVLEN